MRVLCLMPFDFRDRRRKQDEILEVSDATELERADLDLRARQGIVRFLQTADMEAEPATRGYKRRG
jgi:hypothetical protein